MRAITLSQSIPLGVMSAALILTLPVVAASKLEQRLQAAVVAKQWSVAVQLVDQLMESEPKRRGQLLPYRQQLQTLVDQVSTRDEKTMRALYNKLFIGMTPALLFAAVGEAAKPENAQRHEVYRWEFQAKTTLATAATFEIQFVDGRMTAKKLTAPSDDFQKKFLKLENGMTYKQVRRRLTNSTLDGKLASRIDRVEYRWRWKTAAGETSLVTVMDNDRLRKVTWNYEGRIQEKPQ